MSQLFLASTSPYRHELLSRLGVAFETLDPEVDETPFKEKGFAAKELVQILAKEKSLKGLTKAKEKSPSPWVIGSDQVLSLNDEIIGKAGSFDKAFTQLQKLSGQSHQLLTAVSLVSSEAQYHFLDQTTLKMKECSDELLSIYLNFDKPFNCAGSYKIESRGITLFDKIITEDFTAIMGLPLIQLTSYLQKIKFLPI